jgi:hypothetical protein
MTLPINYADGQTVHGTDVDTWTATINTLVAAAMLPPNSALVAGFATTVTSATAITLVVGSPGLQVLTGVTAQTVVLPTTGVSTPMTWMVVNNSSAVATVEASAGATVNTIAAGGYGFFTANATTPTTPAGWFFRQTADESGVYFVDDFGVTPANLAATNVTNLNNLLQNIAPDNSEIVFGPGTYQFSAGLTALTKDFVFRGNRAGTTIAITAAMGSATPFLSLNNTGFYTTLRDLSFVNFATQTSNYVIECNNNANTQIQDCFFTGASQWAGVIDFTGTNSGNGATVKNVYISNFAATAINVSSPLDTMYIEDLEILGSSVAGQIGVAFLNGGAAMMTNCQIIKCNINLQLSAITGDTIASVFATNCFFDQGLANALLITGAGTVARCHFIGCWFTTAATGSSPSCISIATTGTSAHPGIEFKDCFVLNATTGSTTPNGVVITAGGDISIQNCVIAGWVTGISVTPSAVAAGTTSVLITGCWIGASGGVAANGTGIALAAGAPTTYGSVNIQDNTFLGNTTAALTDASTLALGASKIIKDNAGLSTAPRPIIASSAAINTTETYIPTALALPISGLLVGTTFRLTLFGTCTSTAANISTFTVRVGTTGTTPASDTVATAALATVAGPTAGTAGGFKIEILITVRAIGVSATVLECTGIVNNMSATAGIISAGAQAFTAVATSAFSNNSALFLNVSYKSAATTTTSTFTHAMWEVLAQ